MKTVNVPEFLKLAKGLRREHYLIRCAMLDGYPCYYEHNSRIRNLFAPSFTATRGRYYFSKLYTLRTLEHLQRGEEGDNWVRMGDWVNEMRRSRLPVAMLDDEICASCTILLCDEFSAEGVFQHRYAVEIPVPLLEVVITDAADGHLCRFGVPSHREGPIQVLRFRLPAPS